MLLFNVAIIALTLCRRSSALTSLDDRSVTIPPSAARSCHNEVERAKKIEDNHIELMRLAVCLHVNGNTNLAFDMYTFIRLHFPTHSYVLVNMGIVHLKQGNVEKAQELIEQYLAEVGGMHGDGEITDEEALKHGSPCQANNRHKQDCTNALNNLAAAHITSGKNSTAVAMYLSRAIEIGDESMLGDAYANFGGHLAKMGDHDAAADSYIRGFWISLRKNRIDAAIALLLRRAFLVPTVYSSLVETDDVRIQFRQRIHDITELAHNGGNNWMEDKGDLFRLENYKVSIQEIQGIPPLKGKLQNPSEIQSPHFYVHYSGLYDLPIQKKVSEMFALLCPPSLFEVSPHLARNDHITKQRMKRIGFVSSLIGGNEPHGLLVLDVIRSLKGLFQFYVVSIGSKKLTTEFHTASDGAYEVGYDSSAARTLLMSLELDCLVFAEAMNEAIVYFLGYQRYAPTQVLVMGSPVTSGIPNIDYFLSGDLLEHPFRTQLESDHYSEQVVLFDGQAISFPQEQYHPPQDSSLAAGEAKLLTNLSSLEHMKILKNQKAHIYLCFQSIFKIQPSFDYVLIDIIQADPIGHVILQASRYAMQTEKLNSRLKDALSQRFCGHQEDECPAMMNAHSRIHFIPRVKSNDVLELMQQSDVILHPFPFGGSKTASDAINAGVPLVIFPQRYLRGRMAAVFFRYMDLHEVDPDVGSCCIADSVSDYVSKALRLALDGEYQSRVRNAIIDRRHRIFDEKSVSFEWGKFLTRALRIRISDEELASHVGFVREDRHYEAYNAKEMEDEQERWKESVMLSSIFGPQ